MAYRVDIGELRPAVRLADGRLRVEGRIARTGIQIYNDADGNEVREYRPPDEVFDNEAVRSFDYSIVTDDHPAEMVTAQNARALAVGQVVESVRRGDEQWLTADMVINDAPTIAKLEAGKVQLSCGYHADVEFTGGVTPEGERYDAIQKNIRGNHVAIVERARAGSGARVRIDSSGDAFLPAATIHTTTGNQPRFDTMDFEKLYKEATENAVAEKARADKAEERADRAEAELANANERADKADAARAEFEESIPARVAARVDLEMKAHPVLDDADEPYDFTGKTDREIRIAVIEKLGGTVPEGKSDAYVEARFDGKLESVERGDGFDAVRRLAPTATGTPPAARTTREDEFDEAAAMRRMEEHADARWQGEDKE